MSQSRYLESQIRKDLNEKMVFLAGPRQAGKTTLAFTLLGQGESHYFNWDDDQHREKILKREFPSAPGILVLDEIHKYARWRNWLKGFYDTHKNHYKVLVTGSAKLDFYRRGGDSLQGRYHFLRLHPLSLKELNPSNPKTTLEELFHFGSFPEPYFSHSEEKSRRWSRQHRTRVIREDLVSLEKVSEITLLEQLAIRLPDLVGSPLSLFSLCNELQVSQPTVARWVTLLERLYVVFRAYPLGSPKIRAVQKLAKLYFFDWNAIESPGVRFENLVANHLLKWCHFIEDTQGYDMELRYFRDRDQREVDFVILKNRKPIIAVEAKLSDKTCSKDLVYLKHKFPDLNCVQVVKEFDDDIMNIHGIRICGAHHFLMEFV